jgi:L-alanine-DL-glutamate epimerase-like enolase superfamily enzyme
MNSHPPSTPNKTVRIVSMAARRVMLPLKIKVEHASHVRRESENVIVECRLSDGTVGYGEGVPREYVTGETCDRSIGILRSADWSLLKEPVDSFDAGVELADRLTLPKQPGDDRGIVGNAARCAAELALLDAFGRSFGRSLSDVAKRPEFASIFEPKKKVRYTGAITTKGKWKGKIFAWSWRLVNPADVKIKVGIPGSDDVKRLKTFRRIMPRLKFRIDANEAWTAATAADRIRELEPFGISLVEQPVKHEEVASLAEVRKAVKTPIMLDESLCSMIDAVRAKEGGWCDVFNVRLSKCGGFLPSLRLAAYAEANGLQCQLGSHPGESSLLTAAGRHFACSVGGLVAVEGSFDGWLLRRRIVREDLTFSKFGGWAKALTGAGLGVTIDEVALDSVTTETIPLFEADAR